MIRLGLLWSSCERPRRRLVVSFLLAAAAMRVPVLAQVSTDDIFVQSTVACPAGNISGYTTIEAMNSDMEIELNKLRGGTPPREPYMFLLCPETTFDASNFSLTPLLPGAVFICGTMGDPVSGCDFAGGSNQVLVEDPVNITDFELGMISFIGVTFTGFENSAISGNGSNTTVALIRSNFENFKSMFAVSQQNENGGRPFSVQVSGSTITGAMAGALFSNIGGELSLEDVDVDSSVLMTLVSTGSSSTSEGSTFLRRVTVTNSDIADIFVALEAADIDAVDVNISSMVNMVNIFDVGGEGSSAMIEGLLVANNDLSKVVPPTRWIGVNIRENAKAVVTNTTFADNTNIRHVFSASISSSLDIQGAIVTMASGGRVVDQEDVSAIVFANIMSTITVTRVQVEDTTQFTTVIFGSGNSKMDISNVCLGAGSGQGAVYMSEDSTFTAVDNFVDPAYDSSVCQEPGMRLIKEQVGSGCFQANRTDCLFDCMSFFDVDSCQAQVTLAPSMVPSSTTSAPSSTNTTSAPSSSIPTASNGTGAPSLEGTPAPSIASKMPSLAESLVPSPTISLPTSNSSDVPLPVPTKSPANTTSIAPGASPPPTITTPTQTQAPSVQQETAAPSMSSITIGPDTEPPVAVAPTLSPRPTPGGVIVLPTLTPGSVPPGTPTQAPTSAAPDGSRTPAPVIDSTPAPAGSKPTLRPTRSPFSFETYSPVNNEPTRSPAVSAFPTPMPSCDCSEGSKSGKSKKKKGMGSGKGKRSRKGKGSGKGGNLKGSGTDDDSYEDDDDYECLCPSSSKTKGKKKSSKDKKNGTPAYFRDHKVNYALYHLGGY